MQKVHEWEIIIIITIIIIIIVIITISSSLIQQFTFLIVDFPFYPL